MGHTHEDVDAAFSKVSQQLKSVDVETLPDLYKILPESEEIGQIFDVKTWMTPYLSDVEKISFPLHYKFEKDGERVKLSYKGPHYTEWISVEESILSNKPPGKPKTVKQDFSKINIERNLKQIHQLKHLFKNEEAVTFWEDFYKSINEGSRNVPESIWIFDTLPRQDPAPPQIEMEIPRHINDIVNKETTVPQVYL